MRGWIINYLLNGSNLHMLVLNEKNNISATKFQQVIEFVVDGIDKGTLKANSRLPAISQFCIEHSLSRTTVARAYHHLNKRGYITLGEDKSYFVSKDVVQKVKVLLIFNRLCNFKSQVYLGMVDTLKEFADVDLKLHHYDLNILNELIDKYIGKYDHYVIMPHFCYDTDNVDCLNTIRRIPQEKLFILDKNLPFLNFRHRSVYQNFKEDIYQALCSVAPRLVRYDSLEFINPAGIYYPLETVEGVKKFAASYTMNFNLIQDKSKLKLTKGRVYIAIEDEDLVHMMKLVKNMGLIPGQDIGVIALNETPLKELLDITTFSTDFAALGRTAAEMLLSQRVNKCVNKYDVIVRKSL